MQMITRGLTGREDTKMNSYQKMDLEQNAWQNQVIHAI